MAVVLCGFALLLLQYGAIKYGAIKYSGPNQAIFLTLKSLKPFIYLEIMVDHNEK
jgi:hypothetical protein